MFIFYNTPSSEIRTRKYTQWKSPMFTRHAYLLTELNYLCANQRKNPTHKGQTGTVCKDQDIVIIPADGGSSAKQKINFCPLWYLTAVSIWCILQKPLFASLNDQNFLIVSWECLCRSWITQKLLELQKALPSKPLFLWCQAPSILPNLRPASNALHFTFDWQLSDKMPLASNQ